MRAVIFLFHRFLFRFVDFFHHWYWDASRALGHVYLSMLERMDRVFAVRITLKHFFKPLYKDYSVIGHVMGLIFRPLRIAIGVSVYLVWSIAFAAFYLAWLAFPFAVLVMIVREINI